MAMSLAELTEKLNQETYTPRTDAQLKAEAENRYKSQYNQMGMAAKQATETKDLAYQRQLKALEDALAVNQQSLIKDTVDSLASANRYQVTRGMQRSSYGAANAARIQNVGQQNLTALLKQYDTDRGDIETNRTLLAGQLAETLAQYDIDYLNDLNAYIDQQKQIDYEREQAALKNQNDILMALYEYGQAAKGRSSGGSRSSSRGSYTPPSDSPPASTPSPALMNILANGGTLKTSGTVGTSSGVVKNPLKNKSNTNINNFRVDRNEAFR